MNIHEYQGKALLRDYGVAVLDEPNTRYMTIITIMMAAPNMPTLRVAPPLEALVFLFVRGSMSHARVHWRSSPA